MSERTPRGYDRLADAARDRLSAEPMNAMTTEDLMQRLSREGGAARPLPAPYVRAGLWTNLDRRVSAALPMLAACFGLYSLRDLDTRWTLGSRHGA